MNPNRLVELARKHDAYELVDGSGDTFRRRARILQSMWRTEMGYAVGEHRGRKLGSRLEMPWARETLSNYLTDTIRDVVRAEVLDPRGSKDKLYGKPRIFNDLLSSQPLCFNLFGELQRDLPLATAVLRDMTQGRVGEVTAIEFEHSPGRGDPEYLNDRSAFDVYVEFTAPDGGRGFIGIEVKYHEDLRGGKPAHNPRYDEVAKVMGCFVPECRDRLQKMPLQQIWRDHLLAGITRFRDNFEDGFFAFLYPEGNRHCADAVQQYRGCLTCTDTFAAWTLEDVVEAIEKHTGAEWIGLLRDRYLAFGKVTAACDKADGE